MKKSICKSIAGKPMTEHQVYNKEPPKNIPAEKTVLAACLIDCSACAIVLDTLKAEQLYATPHQTIFRTIKAIYDAGDTVDLVSVAEHLDRHGLLDGIGGAAYLAGLEQYVLTTQKSTIDQYCRLVHDAWQRRELIRQAYEIIEDAHKTELENDELIEATERRIAGIDKGAADEKNALSIHGIGTLFDIEVSEHDNVAGDRAVRGDDLTLILGPPGIGKSRVVTQLAIDMFLGNDWFGHIPIHQRDLKWLFFQTENGVRRLRYELGRQLKGIGGETRARIAENLLILAPIKLSDRLLSFKSPEAVARMRAAVRKHDPDMVVFDPYINFFGGESENDATQAAEAIAEFYSIAHSVRMDNGLIIVHHARMGKAAAASAVGWEGGRYGRGSTALAAAARSAINIAPGNAERDGLLVIAHGKCNDGREFEPFAVRLNDESMLYGHDEDFDMEHWNSTVNGVRDSNRAPSITSSIVATVLREMAGEGIASPKRAELKERLMAVTGKGASTAYNAITAAIKDETLIESVGRVCVRGGVSK